MIRSPDQHNQTTVNAYEATHEKSLEDPSAFWGGVAEDIYWFERWNKVLNDSKPPFYRWFIEGMLNTCYNAVDRHVDEGRGDQVTLIHDSPVTSYCQIWCMRS